MVEGFYEELLKTLESLQVYGYLGAFLISILGNIVPFFPVPYLMFVFLMAQKFDPLILGIVAGVGGAIGKLTSYGLGRAGRKLLREKTRKKMTALGMMVGKYGMLAVFLFALTPLPDDVIYVPMGLTKFSLARFMLANALGKIVLTWMIAYGGRAYFQTAEFFLGEGANLTVVLAAVIAMIIITVVLLKIDWEIVLKSAEKRGFRGVLEGILESMKPNKKGE